MGMRLRLLVIMLAGLVVAATFTYPMWRPEPTLSALDEDEFPELDEAQLAAFNDLPPGVQTGYLLMRARNAAMAADLVIARLQGASTMDIQPAGDIPGIGDLDDLEDLDELDALDNFEGEGAIIAARGEFRVPEPDTDEEQEQAPFAFLYSASGEMVILRLPDDRKVLRIQDLEITNGPNLQLVLATSEAPFSGADLGRERITLGPLQSAVGSQTYLDAIPVEVNLANYGSIVIYNSTYDIVFAYAPLR